MRAKPMIRQPNAGPAEGRCGPLAAAWTRSGRHCLVTGLPPFGLCRMLLASIPQVLVLRCAVFALLTRMDVCKTVQQPAGRAALRHVGRVDDLGVTPAANRRTARRSSF